jgi:hypothetical protein
LCLSSASCFWTSWPTFMKLRMNKRYWQWAVTGNGPLLAVGRYWQWAVTGSGPLLAVGRYWQWAVKFLQPAVTSGPLNSCSPQ